MLYNKHIPKTKKITIKNKKQLNPCFDTLGGQNIRFHTSVGYADQPQ